MSRNYSEYLRKRQSIMDDVFRRNGASGVKLTDKETKAASVLEALKKEIYNSRDINLMADLFDNLGLFKKTELYKTIRQMPKGVLQHMHLPASISIQGFIRAFTSSENVDYSIEKRQFKLCKNGQHDPGFQSVVQLKKDEGEAVIEQLLRDLLMMNHDEMNKFDQEHIFKDFNKRFYAMTDVFFYEPVLRKLMEEACAEMMEDGFDGVEIRNVFGYMINENQERATFDEEIDLFQSFKDRFKESSPPLLIGYIHTGVKAKGLSSEDLRKWFDVYRYSLKKNNLSDLFVGFDMVSFEEDTMIKDMAEDLFKLKSENPGTNFIFHAGESGLPAMGNVVDAILLGSKRIGHGLAADKSPVLLDLAKKHGICIETNPVSNFVLGNFRDPFNHPLRLFINSGIACTVNSDDCLFWDCPQGTMDFFVATVFSDLTLQELKWLVLNSITYSYFSKEERKLLLSRFSQKWMKFIEALASRDESSDQGNQQNGPGDSCCS